MYYRFKCGKFIEAKSFEEAKRIFIEEIQKEIEHEEKWCECTCLGFFHRYNCSIDLGDDIPF